MPDGLESELKFRIRHQDLAVLAASPVVAALAVGEPDTDQLETTYYDTADQRLRQAAASLRIRRKGEAFEQTVKRGGDLDRGLAQRAEIEGAVDGPAVDLDRLPDADTAAWIRATIGDAALLPQFTMTVTRQRWLLADGAGGEVEFVLDDGVVVAGDVDRPVIEAEFELKAGDIGALFDIARRVMTAVPVRIATTAKADIGFAILDGRADSVPAAVRAVDVALDGDDSVEASLQRIVRNCLSQVVGNIAVVEAGDAPEGPHQLRVGLRRLRSALSLFKPVIAPVARARISNELRWLGTVVGALRDLDVLIAEIVTPCAGGVETGPLVAVLQERRAAAKMALLAALDGPRAGGLMIDLVAFTEARGWLSSVDLGQSAALAAPVSAFGVRAVKLRWRKVARQGRDADSLSEEGRHDLRKGFKKLRYTLDFLGGQIGRRDERRLVKDVRAAQEVLGYLNDVKTARAMAASLWADDAVRARDDYPLIERALGYCLGWHGARADRAWDEARTLVSLDPDEA